MQKMFGPGATPLVEIDTTGACSTECCGEVEVISSSSHEAHTCIRARELQYNTTRYRKHMRIWDYVAGLNAGQTSGGMQGIRF